MSLVGHGRLGLRAPLRPFSEFIEDSAAEKRAFLELRGGRQVTSWQLESGAMYSAAFSFIFEGTQRDVVGVRVPLSSGLVRAESSAACEATAGTYYYDPDVAVGGTWDDGGFFDDGGYWDTTPLLYVHLPEGGNPNDTTVIAELGFYFGTRGVVHPTLGDDLLAGKGGFEDWDDEDTPTDWSVAESGAGWAVKREDFDYRADLYALRLEAGSGAGSAAVYLDGLELAAAEYRLCGEYQTPAGADPGARVVVSDDGADTNAVNDDGRTYGTEGIDLPSTGGEWRRFVVDFLALGDSRLRLEASGSGGGSVRFDRVELRRIWRWQYYEPRLSSASIPSVETGSNDIFFGGKRVGSGSLTLLNGDGRIERLLGQLDWVGSYCRAYHGGAFRDGGEVLFDDVRRIFTGLIQSVGGTDEKITLGIQDARVLFQTSLPPDIYEQTRFGSLDSRLQGAPRPLWFGAVYGIAPARIDVTANGYGEYELADCTLAPNGIKAVDRVWAYVDETAAGEERSDRRVQLVADTDYTADLATARIEILNDARIIEITESNRRLDFSDGTVRVGAIALGIYIPRTLAVAIETAMNAVSSGITISYSNSTHTYTLAKASGTFQLLINTGANKETSAWTVLGFDRGANQTGALSYTAANAVFADVDKQHVLRVDGKGFKDDASGTYTGSASAAIETGEAIMRCLAARYLPPVTIDEASFTQARQRAPESLGLYLNQTTSIKAVFDALEYSNIANIVLDGEGRIFYLVYVGDVPAGITDIYDRDILEGSWEAELAPTDVYATVSVRYRRSPSSGKYFARSASDSSTSLRFNRSNSRPFDTLLVLDDNAQTVASRMLELARVPARKIRFAAKGKLVDKKVGDKIRVNRTRGLDASGSISATALRILSVRQEYQQGRSQVECVDDVITVAGVACLTSCQNVCEASCQQGCEVSCESVCQSNCQAGCQTGCQVGCEVTCQQGCEVSCETSCEAGACQTACQTGACETNCQLHCQVGCEVSCQTTCELACQTSCQLNCQDTCEVNCQTECQQVCQLACQLNCMTLQEQTP